MGLCISHRAEWQGGLAEKIYFPFCTRTARACSYVQRKDSLYVSFGSAYIPFLNNSTVPNIYYCWYYPLYITEALKRQEVGFQKEGKT